MIALVVMQITVQFAFGAGCLRLVFAATVASRIELVAFVVPACVGAVVAPVSHADPAKLVRTTPAGHVVATLILFNPRHAFRARFGVRQDPVGRFGLVSALVLPQSDLLASAGRMGLLPAHNAERCRTGNALGRSVLDAFQARRRCCARHKFAAFSGAPARKLVGFDEGTELVGEVLLQQLGLIVAAVVHGIVLVQAGLHFHFSNEFVATCLRTCRVLDAGGAILDSVGAKVRPARLAEHMAARHSQRRLRGHAVEANPTQRFVCLVGCDRRPWVATKVDSGVLEQLVR
mmetsp:Transcript_27956/g.78337  ORF Transcript_27956/g.78337 Transcript_27956/m.78337 type:complete len:289 (+) Transcript_27956:492-1358(+)